MENPEKIEIEGLKTIHKLCKFGADHNMEGCTFTEIVERMFSKIEQMKTQVNTLDEMLLNQGEVLTQAKAQANQKIKLLLCDEHLKKCESPTGVFNSQYPDEEPCLICLAKEAKAQAVPEWISMEDKYPKAGESVLICINGIRQNIAYFYDCSVSNEYSDHDWFEPVFTGGEAGDECVVKTEDVTHWMLLPQEPAND